MSSQQVDSGVTDALSTEAARQVRDREELNPASKKYRLKFAASLGSSLWTWSETGCPNLPAHVEDVRERLLDFTRMPGDEYLQCAAGASLTKGMGSSSDYLITPASMEIDYDLLSKCRYVCCIARHGVEMVATHRNHASATQEWKSFYYDHILCPYVVRCRHIDASPKYIAHHYSR
jgi:hypothetical protein